MEDLYELWLPWSYGAQHLWWHVSLNDTMIFTVWLTLQDRYKNQSSLVVSIATTTMMEIVLEIDVDCNAWRWYWDCTAMTEEIILEMYRSHVATCRLQKRFSLFVNYCVGDCFTTLAYSGHNDTLFSILARSSAATILRWNLQYNFHCNRCNAIYWISNTISLQYPSAWALCDRLFWYTVVI